MARIFLTPVAQRDYKKLPTEVREHVADLFDGSFARDPLAQSFDIKKLKLPFAGYRLRLGHYRVLFVLNAGVITVYSIKHRKDAYK